MNGYDQSPGRLPALPDEDQGYFYVFPIGPEGSSLERTEKVANKVEKILRSTPGVADVLTIGGFDLINNINVPNTSTIIVVLKPWGQRKTPELSVNGIMASVRKQTAGITEAMVAIFNAPPIQGLSKTGGFEFELQDLTGGSLDTLSDVTQKMIQNAAKEPALLPLMAGTCASQVGGATWQCVISSQGKTGTSLAIVPGTKNAHFPYGRLMEPSLPSCRM